ncbi:MAG: hypothetical protein WCR40_02665 [Candidatus Paceibacterota bacterium]
MNTNNLIKQYLPTYKENFKNDPRWITKKSAHYIFHYFSNSVADLEINKIEKIQEESFDKIVSLLKIEIPKEKIKYYFYPDFEIKKELMGDDGYAQAVHKDFAIHVIYTREHKPLGEHEDTHLLSLPLGQATSFFAEGLAEYLSWGRTIFGKTKEYWLEEGKNKILPIEQIVTHQDWMNTPDDIFIYYYSFAGYFVKKIIEDFGIDKFKTFYSEINRDMNFEEINRIFTFYFNKNIKQFKFEMV